MRGPAAAGPAMTRRGWRWIIGVVVAVPAVVLAGALVFFAVLDPKQFREPIRQAAIDATGRELVIEGPISFSVLPGPRVVVEDARMANASWGSRPDMLRIKRFEIVLHLWPLAFGELRIKRVDMQEPDILLEVNDQGEANWHFTPKMLQPVAPDAVVVEPKAAEPFVLPQIDLLRAVGGRLVFKPGDGSRHVLELESLDGNDADLPAPLRLALTGTLNGLPLTFRTALSGSGERYELNDLAATLGNSDLAGQIAVVLAVPRLYVEVLLAGQRVDLPELASALQRGRPADAAAATAPAAAGATKQADRVFSTTPIPVAALQAFDARLALELSALRGRHLTITELRLDSTLQDGVLAVQPLRLAFGGGKFDMNLRFDTSTTTPIFSLRGQADPFDVGALYHELTGDDGLEASGKWSVDLVGQGRSPAEIAATLEGSSNMVLGEGRFRPTKAGTLVGGLSGALGTLFVGQPEWTKVYCAASRFVIVQGLATNEVMLLDNEFTMIAGEGQIDLRKERFDLVVSAHSKVPTITVTVPVKIRGSLSAPRLVPDEKATLLRVGGLLTGSGFAATALASLIDLGGDKNYCVQLAAGGEEAAKVRTKIHRAPVDAAVDKAADTAGAVVKGVGKGLKKLFGDDD